MIANPGSGVAVPVVWKQQRLNFVYMGRTSRYSCDGLREKMLALLLDFGARRDLSVTAENCGPTAAPQRIAGSSFNVVFASPAMPDGAAEKPAHTGDPAAVEARFEKFMLTNDAFRNLGIADCELVEEFARQILPKLAVRNVRQDIGCVPYQEGASHFWVRGEILKVLSRS
jgi:hypothetical protein